jgi:hypothetical protein
MIEIIYYLVSSSSKWRREGGVLFLLQMSHEPAANIKERWAAGSRERRKD